MGVLWLCGSFRIQAAARRASNLLALPNKFVATQKLQALVGNKPTGVSNSRRHLLCTTVPCGQLTIICFVGLSWGIDWRRYALDSDALNIIQFDSTMT